MCENCIWKLKDGEGIGPLRCPRLTAESIVSGKLNDTLAVPKQVSLYAQSGH